MVNLTKGMKVEYTGTQYLKNFKDCALLTGTIMEIADECTFDNKYTEYTVKFDDMHFDGHSGSTDRNSYYDNTYKSWFVLGKDLKPIDNERGDNVG